MRALAISAGFAAVVLSAAAARAEADPARAAGLRSEGDALFAAGDYREAASRFEAAWSAGRDRADLLRIGRCRGLLNQNGAALDALFRYLQSAAEVRGRSAGCAALPAKSPAPAREAPAEPARSAAPGGASPQAPRAAAAGSAP